jgi:hypothetical protein
MPTLNEQRNPWLKYDRWRKANQPILAKNSQKLCFGSLNFFCDWQASSVFFCKSLTEGNEVNEAASFSSARALRSLRLHPV